MTKTRDDYGRSSLVITSNAGGLASLLGDIFCVENAVRRQVAFFFF